jgi:hypothetical protein
MALPTTFGPLTAASMAQLDGNFAAVGALTTILCTSTGTNQIVLTPAANQPAITGYGLPNPLKFGFVAPNSTSGAVTLEILALGFLPVYVPAGSQATSGTLSSGQYYEVTYTTGANYNSGNGAWVLSSYQPATGLTAAANASVSGLRIINDAVNPSTSANINFFQACMVSVVGAPVFVTNGAYNVDLTTGTVTPAANGMDGESRPAGGWVYFYIISTGSGGAGLGTLTPPTAGAPNLPAGYSYYAYVGAMFCDGSSNLLRSRQRGGDAQYVVSASSNTATLPVMASGAAGTYSSTAPTLAVVSVLTVVPPTASVINMMITNAWKSGTNSNVLIAPNPAYGGANNGPTGSNGLMWPFNEDIASPTAWFAPMGLESSNIYWASSAAGAAIGCLGWVDYCSAAGG